MATPICALAAEILRSAAAMSGRRSSSVDGMPYGIAGTLPKSGAGSNREFSRRLTDQDRDRVLQRIPLSLDVDRCSMRVFQLSFRCHHVGFRRYPNLVTVARDVELFW